MKPLTVTFDVPHEIIGQFVAGDLNRSGGVIRNSDGKVRMRVREISIQPLPPSDLSKSIGKPACQVLGLLGPAAGAINLGATVVFGKDLCEHFAASAIANPYSPVRSELKDFFRTLASIDWTVEADYWQISQQIAYIDGPAEDGMRSSYDLAWTAQMLRPGSEERARKLEHANQTASLAVEQLILSFNRDYEQSMKSPNLSIGANGCLPSADAIMRLLLAARNVCIAQRLKCLIFAESDLVNHASNELQKVLKNVTTKVSHILRLFLRDVFSCNVDYSLSLVCEWANNVTSQWSARNTTRASRIPRTGFARPQNAYLPRLMRWYNTFCGPYPELLKDLTGDISAGRSFPRAIGSNIIIGHIADAVDGYIEDVDRLQGMVAELESCGFMGISWHEYEERLKIDEAPAGKRLALFTATDAITRPAPI